MNYSILMLCITAFSISITQSKYIKEIYTTFESNKTERRKISKEMLKMELDHEITMKKSND